MVAADVANGLADQNSEESSEWKRLQSLMMQLRKCCDHPYLFHGADPNPSEIDEGIVTMTLIGKEELRSGVGEYITGRNS